MKLPTYQWPAYPSLIHWAGVCLFLFNHALAVAQGTDQSTLPMLLAEKKELIADATFLLRMADICLDRGNDEASNQSDRLAAYEQGARNAQQALALDEQNAHAHYLYAANLGSAAQLKGIMASALTVHDLKRNITRALELNPNHAEALHMMGMMLEELPWMLGGDRDSALDFLRRAIAVDPNEASARLDLAKIYIKRKDVQAARKELDTLLRQSLAPDASLRDQRYREEAFHLRDSLQTSRRGLQ